VSDPPGPAFHPREILSAFSRREVVYVVIGGVAVQAHGGQRLTQDLDIVVPERDEEFERLAGALTELDARILGPGGERSATVPSATLLASGDLWRLECAHGRLDVTTLPAALGRFADLRARAHEIELDGLTVPVASREDLIAMKRATGRRHDLEDVALLESLSDEEPE
jgi:Nucleotidyl transferase AbiEii toxin, Type IV TA system